MIRKQLKNIILFLIHLVELYQYKNKKLDELNELKKVIDILNINNLSVESDYGFVPIEEINLTQPYTQYELELENGLKLECANTHIIYGEGYKELFVKDLQKGDKIITKYGLSPVINLKKSKHKISMYDLSLNGPQPSYYINDLLSHNTVSAAIVILHFVLFNPDKGVMIVANKGKTVAEIIRKIKDIYKLLPFFLKQGVISWNEKSIAFDNNSRIQSENRTKDPSIGFTIDLLYLDEFAKVPNNIVGDYYGAVVPVVSSIKNSKIIITSTPNGFNLFHDLLIDAERDIEDPLKNQYEAKRVYWWQVDGRLDCKLLPLAYKFKKYNITINELKEHLKSKYNFELSDVQESNRNYIYIKYDENNEFTTIDEIRNIRIDTTDENGESKKIPLVELCMVSNWKEDETKLIGGEDKFKQEYDLEFVTGDKTIFNSEQMTQFKQNALSFEYQSFKELDDKLVLPYSQLKWLKGFPNIFDKNKMKDYHIVASVDLGEGLSQDYTVINIFRVMPKSKELIELTHDKLNNVYEYFKIEQIGMFRSNNWSITEVAEIFYLIFFELFDPEKTKVVLEYNTYGGELLARLPYVFNEENEYNTGIFVRYKHRKDDKKVKIGMKITGGDQNAAKKLLVKSLQDAVKKKLIRFVNDVTVREIGTFVKKETSAGNYTYKCESGNDDTTMTLVTISSIFQTVTYKNLIEEYLDVLEPSIKQLIEKYVYKNVTEKSVDYEGTRKSHNKVYKQNYNNLHNKYPTNKNPWSR